VASQQQVKDKAVDVICQAITEKLPNVKFSPECKTDVEAVWDAAVAERLQVASQKQVKDKAVDEISQAIAEKFPDVKFNPDCKTDVEAQLTLPSSVDIEKLICEVESQKQVEDYAADKICLAIAEEFPIIKFNSDCKADGEAVWDSAVAKCPRTQLAPPCPADIEELICEVASRKQVEDKAVDEISQALAEKFPSAKFNPDCKTDVEAVWGAAAAKRPRAQPTLPSPADIEEPICEVESQKQVEDKAVDQICQVTTEKAPNIKCNPDCQTDAQAVWGAAVAERPRAQLTPPSPADIQQLICEVAPQMQVKDKAVDESCEVLAEKFPDAQFNPDCRTDVGAVWGAAVAKCPQAQLTLPSPVDIEKLICEVASEKQVDDKAVDEICQVIAETFPDIKFNPDCETVVEAVWGAAVAECPHARLTPPSPADIEKLICEVESQKQVEDKAVDESCEVLAERFPNVKFNPDCKTDVEAVWGAAAAWRPQARLTPPSPADIEKLICEVESQKQVEDKLTPPSPADIQQLICEVAPQMQVKDKAVDESCEVLAEKFPDAQFNPDCKTAQLTLPSPVDIEKLICEVASEKQVEDKAVDESREVLTEKFPHVKFNSDCETDAEAVWGAAAAKCPRAQLTPPSPADIEKLICEVVSQEQVGGV
ncbi:unnamed protein product, partial [Prorocentrum cordatum]